MFICDPCHMPFPFFIMGPQTEITIFLKILLKFGAEIDYMKESNKNIYSLKYCLIMILIQYEVEHNIVNIKVIFKSKLNFFFAFLGASNAST